jgi:hypothetical protein
MEFAKQSKKNYSSNTTALNLTDSLQYLIDCEDTYDSTMGPYLRGTMIGLLNHSMQGDADSISSATGKTNSDTPA